MYTNFGDFIVEFHFKFVFKVCVCYEHKFLELYQASPSEIDNRRACPWNYYETTPITSLENVPYVKTALFNMKNQL